MKAAMCDFVTLKTERDCKKPAVWMDSAGSVKVCGTHKAELLRSGRRLASTAFVRLGRL